MPEKPIPPQKEKMSISSILIPIILFVITSFFIVSYAKTDKESRLYNADLAKYNRIVAYHEEETNKYCREVASYIHSIDPSYDIDENGTIPVNITITRTRDASSQYIGSELLYNYRINNTSVANNKDIRISISHETIFETEIIEQDPSSDDIGRKKDSVYLYFPDINNGFSLDQQIRVREYHGVKAGNTALYNMTYSVIPKKILSLTRTQWDSFPQYPVLPEEPQKADYKIDFWDVLKNYMDVRLYVYLAFILWGTISFYDSIHKPRARYQETLEKYNKAIEEYTSSREEFVHMLSGKTIRELAGVPESVLFTNDDLPYTVDKSKKYGSFTVFVTPSGSRYHRDQLCSKSAYPIHMFKVSHRYSPCAKCAKNFAIQKPVWYLEYLDLKEKSRLFEISEEKL